MAINKQQILQKILEGLDVSSENDLDIKKKKIDTETIIKKRKIQDILISINNLTTNANSPFYHVTDLCGPHFKFLCLNDNALKLEDIQNFVEGKITILLVFLFKWYFWQSYCSYYLSENEYMAIINKLFENYPMPRMNNLSGYERYAHFRLKDAMGDGIIFNNYEDMSKLVDFLADILTAVQSKIDYQKSGFPFKINYI